jgi:hypothetical protein
MTERRRWKREDLLVVINLYHKLTFGQMHARHPAITAMAKVLGRGAKSVAMSSRLKGEMSQRCVADSFGAYAGVPLQVPDDAALPSMEYLAEHRARVFLNA